jgi:cation diffusion facilitator family transporter
MRTSAANLVHDHVFLASAHDANTRRTLWVVALTAAMMVAEIAAGALFNSMALLADGFHMATHAGALAVAAGAYRYARLHAHDRSFSFGTGKVGDLAGFASALILGVVALGIGFESVTRLWAPRQVAFTEAAVVAAVGLLINLVSAFMLGGGHAHHGHGHDYLHDHAHGHDGHHHGHDHPHPPRDNNLQAALAHVLADALTSVLAIVALLCGRFFNWTWLDPLMGVVGALVIAAWAWSLMRDTAGMLLDKGDPHVESEVRELVEAPGDAVITDLHVWRIGPSARAAIVSVAGAASTETVRTRLAPVHELAHLTVEARQA